jgi:hypothetical protein
MERLTQEQLAQIVAEVGRLQQKREAEVDEPQVKQILEELNLPPELLDEALIQVKRRKALEVEQRRNRWITAGVALAVVAALATGGYFYQQHNAEIAHVSAQQNRITLVDNDTSLNVVNRLSNPQVYYRVTLKDAPIGKKLSLSCDWVDPSGQIVKQTPYQTKEVSTPIWDTRCRYIFGANAPVGTWQVRMFLEGHPLSNSTFEVR